MTKKMLVKSSKDFFELLEMTDIQGIYTTNFGDLIVDTPYGRISIQRKDLVNWRPA